MTKPNFFIVGAPKCGTTALSEYLRSLHANICRLWEQVETLLEILPTEKMKIILFEKFSLSRILGRDLSHWKQYEEILCLTNLRR